MERLMVRTENLSKRYGGQLSVNSVDIRVPEGSVYGFLGPNGAGKSTTMKMLLGLVKPTAGQVEIMGERLDGHNRLNILRNSGSLIESPAYYGHLTGRENLEIVAMLKGAAEEEIREALHIVRMENQQNKKVKQYSLGMKQRLGLAAALLGKPKLLLLDEPTNGLDPAGIQEMRELIASLPERFDMTVMVSSHLLGEIDQMASHVGIIDKGELIFQDSLEHLHEHSRRQIRLRAADSGPALRVLSENGIPARMEEDKVVIDDYGDERTAALVTLLVQTGVQLIRVEEYQKSLEEIFLSLTGRQVSL